MNTELNILKQISENKGKAPVQLIAKGLKMRNDYIRYLCIELIKKGLAKKLKGRDWYKITRKGQKEIGKTEKSMKIIPLENYGVKVISIGLLVDDSAPVIWRGPMASGAVKQFMTDVEWGELDYLIFDMPPGTGDIQLTLVQTIPLSGAVIVTTPQEVSLIDARKALKMFDRVKVPVLGIVENMSYFIAPDTGKKYDIFGTGGGSNLSEKFKVPFLGGMPIDPQIRKGGDEGKPIVYDKENAAQGKVMIEISKNLVKEVEKNNLNSQDDIEIVLNN